MTIFQILKTDHRHIAQLMNKIEKSGKKPALREKLFAQFVKEIQLHSKSEQQSVYKPLADMQKTREVALQAHEEHSLIDHLISQLTGFDSSDERWSARFSVLKDIVEHHVKEEEHGMFKKMRNNLSAVQLKEMALEMQTAKHNPALFAIKSMVRSVGDKADKRAA